MQLGRHHKEWLHVGTLSKTFGCYPDPSQIREGQVEQAISWFTLGLWGVEAYYEGILEEQLHSYFLGQGKPWSKLQVGGSSHSALRLWWETEIFALATAMPLWLWGVSSSYSWVPIIQAHLGWLWQMQELWCSGLQDPGVAKMGRLEFEQGVMRSCMPCSCWLHSTCSQQPCSRQTLKANDVTENPEMTGQYYSINKS